MHKWHLTKSFALNAQFTLYASFAPQEFFTRITRLCIDLTLKSFAPDALFVSGVNAP